MVAAAQLTRVRQIVEGLGPEITSAAEAREILAPNGGDGAGF